MLNAALGKPDGAQSDQGSKGDGRPWQLVGLFLKEYELAVERYDNIYKAVWQNFNYLVLLSAGIATLGPRIWSTDTTIAAILSPIAFWFLATYIPMDSYARGSRRRAAQIEEILNRLFISDERLETRAGAGAQQGEATTTCPKGDENTWKWRWECMKTWWADGLDGPTPKPAGALKAELAHFRDFSQVKPGLHFTSKRYVTWFHVSNIVNVFGIFLVISCGWFWYRTFTADQTTQPNPPTLAEMRMWRSPSDSAELARIYQIVLETQRLNDDFQRARLAADTAAALQLRRVQFQIDSLRNIARSSDDMLRAIDSIVKRR